MAAGGARRATVVVVLGLLLVSCGPSGAQPAQPAAPAPAPAPPPVAAAKPAQPAKPAAPAAAPAPPSAPAVKPAQPAKSGDRKQLTMGTTQAASSSYIYAVSAAKVLNSQVSSVNVTAVESGASVENINRMGQGSFHLGIATADTAYQAVHGLGPWAGGKAIQDLRVLWVYDLFAANYVVREDSGVKALADLDGKDYHPGMRGSADETRTKTVFDALGIKARWYTSGSEDAIAAIRDKRIAGMTKGSSLVRIDPVILNLMSFTPIRVLGLTQEQADMVLAKLPYYPTTQIPAGTYKAEWNAQPIRTISSVVMIAARVATLAEDVAYQMTKAIVEDNKSGGAGVQAGAFPSIKDNDVAKLTLDNATSPLHAGAQKYYVELGLKIPDKLKSPEAK